jgi:hypothetical protein
MDPFAYRDHGKTPKGYECSVCGDTGVKLWRQYQTFLNHIQLMCRACAERDQGKQLQIGCDQIGWMIPAVPTEEGYSFWGYTSVPDAGVEWWKALSMGQPNSTEA